MFDWTYVALKIHDILATRERMQGNKWYDILQENPETVRDNKGHHAYRPLTGLRLMATHVL